MEVYYEMIEVYYDRLLFLEVYYEIVVYYDRSRLYKAALLSNLINIDENMRKN